MRLPVAARAFLVLAFLLASLPAGPALAGDGEWTVANPAPYNPYDLVINPESTGIIYATSQNVTFRSEDGGGEWCVAAGMPRQAQLAFDPLTPAIMYAASGGQLQKRVGGAAWAAVAPAVLQSVIAVAVNPDRPNQVWVNTQSGLFRSEDGGASWSSGKLPANGQVRVFGLGGADMRHVYTGMPGQGFFHSENGGESWVKASDGPSRYDWYALQVDQAKPGTLYMTTQEGIFRSTDHGATWSAIQPPQNNYRSAVLLWTTADGGSLYTTAGQVFFRSKDGGTSWQASQPKNVRDISRLVVDPKDPMVMYALSQGRVFKSADAGATWSEPAPAGGVLLAAAHPTAAGVLFGNRDLTALRSADSGDTWQAMGGWPQNTGIGVVYFTPGQPDRILAGAGNALFLSTDGGQSWQPTGMPTTGTPRAVATAAGNDALIVVSLGNVILRSVDGGTAWSSAQLPNGAQASGLWIAPDKPDRVLAATSSGLYRSDDRAMTWQAAGNPNPGNGRGLWSGLAPNDVYGDFDAGLLFSADAGDSWTVSPLGFAPNTGVQRVVRDWTTADLFYALAGQQIFLSPDAGQHWQPLGAALPFAPQALSVNGTGPRQFYAGDSYGNPLWRLSMAGVPTPPPPTATPTRTPSRTPLPTATRTAVPTRTPTGRPQAQQVKDVPPTPLATQAPGRNAPVPAPLSGSGDGQGLSTTLIVLGVAAVLVAVAAGGWFWLAARGRKMRAERLAGGVSAAPAAQVPPRPQGAIAPDPAAPQAPATGQVFCPFCGRPNPAGGKFCIGCGKPLPGRPGAAAGAR